MSVRVNRIVSDSSDHRTDDEIIQGFEDKITVFRSCVQEAARGTISGVIGSGPAGFGKSHHAKDVLGDAHMYEKLSINDISNIDLQTAPEGLAKRIFVRKDGSRLLQPKFREFHGSITPPALYRQMYDWRYRTHTLLLDDVSATSDPNCNLLLLAGIGNVKASVKRRIDRATARDYDDGTPQWFNYLGSIVFNTNIDFVAEAARGVLGIEPLLSRCFYVDFLPTLTPKIKSVRSDYVKFLRYKAIGVILPKFEVAPWSMDLMHGYASDDEETVVGEKVTLSPDGIKEVLDFFDANLTRFREYPSLRTFEKIALWRCVLDGNPKEGVAGDWRRHAEITLCS